MLEIKELRLQAIGRFVEEQVISFDNLGKLVQVDGIRNDTGASSGSGKSTVFNSLDFLFGLNDIPSSVLQSRFTKEGISVTMTGLSDGKDLAITRGKGKLSVTLDGETTTGSKLAEEKIDQILGMPRKLFRPLLHKRQKEGGFFLQFTPKEIHEFLTDALGLSEIRVKAELVDKKLKTLGDQATLDQGSLDQARSGLNATISATLTLGEPPAKEVDQSTVVALKKSYESAQEAVLPIKARHSTELQALEITRPIARQTSVDQSTLQALEAKLSVVGRKIDEIVSQNSADVKEERSRASRIGSSIQAKKVQLATLAYNVQNGTRARSEAATLALEVKKIRDSVCPTCEQSWATEAAKAREGVILAKIKSHGETIALAVVSAQDTEHLLSEISSLVLQATEKAIPLPAEYSAQRIASDEVTTKIGEERRRIRDSESAEHQLNRAQIEQFGQAQRGIMERHQAEIQQVSGQVDITRRIFETATHKFRSYEQARSTYETSIKSMAEQKAKYEANCVEYQDKLTSLTADLILAEELKKAIKGYTSCSFDEALEYIGIVATEIIRAIPNMANATIQLEGIRETKDGKVKEEVNAVINMDGELAIPIKSLSGGERTSLDLAIDLAVLDLLETRTGKGTDLFILDEPFQALDSVNSEQVLEMLINYQGSKRLIVVDHDPITKQMVTDKILVIREGQTSRIDKT